MYKCWADEVEAEKREEVIKLYRPYYIPPRGNVVRQKLDKGFLKLYEKGLNDTQIAERLKVSTTSTGNYRKELGLEKQRHSNWREKNV